MKVTVCDVCGKRCKESISLQYGTQYNGTDTDSLIERFDLCDHHVYFILLYVLGLFGEDENKAIIKYIKDLVECNKEKREKRI